MQTIQTLEELLGVPTTGLETLKAQTLSVLTAQVSDLQDRLRRRKA